MRETAGDVSDLASASGAPAILLDVTRSVHRVGHAAPTGIDRVERAYFDWVLNHSGLKCAFLCRIRGGLALLDREAGTKVFRKTRYKDFKTTGMLDRRTRRRVRAVQSQVSTYFRAKSYFRTAEGGARALRALGMEPSQTLYLNVSHANLDRWNFAIIKDAGVSRIVAFVHDVISVDYPEFFTELGVTRFVEKLKALEAYADALIFNSAFTEETTLRRLPSFADCADRRLVAHLGVEDGWTKTPDVSPVSPAPYFVVLGTIEPRKNHMLLLNVWRRLAQTMDAPPHLQVIGWRGWENENVVDFLERSPLMGRCVFERPNESDQKLWAWVRGARAVLYPTFVEGFGIPVVEALSCGTPVICSDLAVLREVGGDRPDYLDPLDGPGWERAIRAYAADPSPARDAQLARLSGFHAPTWDEHFTRLAEFLHRMLTSPSHVR